MKGFYKKEMEVLKKYQNNFQTALYSDYSRNVMRSDLEKIVAIYERYLGKSYPMNFSCGSCQLRLLKLVGKIYFDTQEEEEKEKKNKVAEGTETPLKVNKIQKKATKKE